jgi:hypothetical protein
MSVAEQDIAALLDEIGVLEADNARLVTALAADREPDAAGTVDARMAHITDVKFGVLMFESHALGRCMLEELKLRGLTPALIIEERSQTGARRAGWFDRQMASARPDLPSVASLLDAEWADGGTVHAVVANINDDQVYVQMACDRVQWFD